ncbi:PREDICTED: glutamyl aminopeptidase-like [Cyphomyrmex costatus]|uniref:glutamyl aminopeptidase-like n=1 Tax=Cyphomyrmex costatus TaxID=456900 RepID=UPI0008523216|nr:PREDICTED: glutamyl aminopeptidase-like [Cyphomyrmex costatus]
MERPTYVPRNFWLPTLLNTTILFTYITTDITYKYLQDTYSYNPEDDNAIGVLNNLSLLNDFQPSIAYYVEPLHYDIKLTLRIEKYDSNKTMKATSNEHIIPRIEEGRWVILPHIQETGTRQLFPCWDERHLKTTFTISVKHPANFFALTNMPLRMLDSDDIEHNFKKSFSQTKSLFYAQQVMKNISFHLEYEFGGIKIPKIDHIVIPHFSYNITTKLGFVFHSERELIYHEELGHIMNRIEIARSITRKTAHQWFGDTLGPFWSNYWLHDGLATLFGDEIVAKVV